MATHRYATGDRVMVRADGGNPSIRPGMYTITRVMPETSMGCQYRVKSTMDQHERVLDEAQLQKA